MRTPVALFPFSSWLLPFVRQFEELQHKYSLRKLVSPCGLGLAGRDASYCCNHPDVGIAVTDGLDPEDPTWDVLLLISTIGSGTVEPARLDCEAERALRSGKSVQYLGTSGAEVPKKVLALAEAYPGMVHVHTGDVSMQANFRLNNHAHSRIDTQVILVGGLVEEADTSEVFLRLTARLRADGFCVTAICGHLIGGLFGFHALSPIFGRGDLTEAGKTQELSAFVKALETNERPSVIIIEAPDALMRYNDFAPNGFGLRTYMMCQAVSPDFLICCVPCEMAVGSFLDTLSSDLERRLGSPIHAVHVSNLVMDSIDLVQTHDISYVHAGMVAVSEQCARESIHSSIPLFDVVGCGIQGLYVHLCKVMRLGVRG